MKIVETIKKNKSTFLIPICIATILTVVTALFVCKYRTPRLNNPAISSPTIDSTPKQTHIEGTIVCLPHKDTSGPQTEECAIGIQTNDGKYYALDTSQFGPTISVLYNTGNTISADGLLTPIENLSSNHWQIYNVQGIFTVNNSLEQVNNTP